MKRNVLNNEKGIALAMILVLSATILAIMAGMIYMVTTGIKLSGTGKRYSTVLEAAKGCAEVPVQVIEYTKKKKDEEGSFTLVDINTAFGHYTSFSMNTTQECFEDKITNTTDDWTAAGCDDSIADLAGGSDMAFKIGMNPTYVCYAKISGSRSGNTKHAGNYEKGGVINPDKGLGGSGSSGGGDIPVLPSPYVFSVEILALRADLASRERAMLSVLYQY